ncbi:MAG: transglycosylase, partial [Clostridia bacterium]|nr:transglycosylase [Clostridia bacterium]
MDDCMQDRIRSNGGISLADTNQNNRERRERRQTGFDAASVALTAGKVLGTLLLIGITTAAILACFATVYIKTVIIPQAEVNVSNFNLNLSSTIYYTDPQTGADKELRTLHGGENRVWVPYEQIPQNLVHAAVSIEDERFYKHHGVDWKRTAGAFLNMFLGMKDTYGGSTLTQQLIKNITDQDDVTVKRKILEIFRALEFEKEHSKEEILEWYLNYIYFGESSYGVYTAAYTYFGKNVSDLTLAECTSLIGITNNPSKYDPYISENTRNNNKQRQETVLYKMEELGYITEAERDAAAAEELQFQRGEDESRPVTVYTWYEDQVIRDVISDLSKTMGWSKDVAQQMVYNGGLSIYSCYNPNVQKAVDDIYLNTENLPYQSPTGQNMQSAITIIDNVTGNVVALAGGMGEKDRSLTFNRATRSERQPGSSIKPLAVYSPAIEMGLISPATVIDDSPYSIEGGNSWPVNAVGYYKGLTTVYEALQNSVNTIAVKIMANYLTPEVAYDFLEQRYHITTLEPGRTENNKVVSDKSVAPLALGGLTDGATTLEMA